MLRNKVVQRASGCDSGWGVRKGGGALAGGAGWIFELYESAGRISSNRKYRRNV